MMETVASRCREAQLRIVAGETAGPLQEHIVACSECAFVADLSRRLGDDSAELDAAHDPISELLERACRANEPLMDRYRLLEPRGRGGQGVVYRAEDLETGDVVAVKVVRLRKDEPRESAAEVGNARRVRHANVCGVFHTERHGGMRLIVMEYIDGGDLTSRLGTAPAIALELFAGTCAGVAAAHDEGVLHLDLKPRNVLLRHGKTPVVTDFGLSVRVDDDADARAAGGTPAYMAPEQWRDQPVNARTDVYALGLLLGDLLGPRRHRARHTIARATSEDPAARFADPLALAAAARAELGRRRRRAMSVAAIAGLAAVAGAGYALWPSGSGDAEQFPGPAPWRPEWGHNVVPDDARNVAVHPDVVVTPSHPAWACGNNPSDLVDGVTQYSNWEHGFAFPVPGERGGCVPLSWLQPTGHCGELQPEARVCEFTDEGSIVRDDLVGDLGDLSPKARERLGQHYPGEPPGERHVTIELDRPRTIRAVRTWHHGRSEVPGKFRIEVPTATGWRTVLATEQNTQAMRRDWYQTGVAGSSAPVTAMFPPTETRAVRFTMDTRTMIGERCQWANEVVEVLDRRDECPPGHGWLYEVEVLAW